MKLQTPAVMIILIFVTSQNVKTNIFKHFHFAVGLQIHWTCLRLALRSLAGSLKWNVWPAELKWPRRVVFRSAQASESIYFSTINPYSDCCWLTSVNNLRLSRSLTAFMSLISLSLFYLISACHWITIRALAKSFFSSSSWTCCNLLKCCCFLESAVFHSRRCKCN